MAQPYCHSPHEKRENQGLRDYRKLNVITVIDTFPLLFTDSVLDVVAGHEMYCLMDGISGYNQVCMHPDD